MTDFRETTCSICHAEVQPDNMAAHTAWHDGLGAAATSAAREDREHQQRNSALGGADFR